MQDAAGRTIAVRRFVMQGLERRRTVGAPLEALRHTGDGTLQVHEDMQLGHQRLVKQGAGQQQQESDAQARDDSAAMPP
jgi:hypothetical protein